MTNDDKIKLNVMLDHAKDYYEQEHLTPDVKEFYAAGLEDATLNEVMEALLRYMRTVAGTDKFPKISQLSYIIQIRKHEDKTEEENREYPFLAIDNSTSDD